jgi:hypothetical protein
MGTPFVLRVEFQALAENKAADSNKMTAGHTGNKLIQVVVHEIK